MTESTLERRLSASLRRSGCLCYKFVSPGLPGVPDRIVITPAGKIIFVELKTESGRLSPQQSAIHQQLRKHGQDVRVLYGSAACDAFLTEVIQNAL